MSIIDNRKATHDYFIEERFEAGLSLQGWEVKSIREGRVQLKESYVIVRDGEIFIFGMHVSPLPTASTHIHPDAVRTRKLLLKAEEISKLIGKVGSVFTSTATQHGGQESTILSTHTVLLHQGMVIVGLPYSFQGQMTLSEITGGSPYGASTIAAGDGSRQPSENELAGARYQGKHVAGIAAKLAG